MEEIQLTEVRWSSLEKICFRFIFVYVILYCLPFPFYIIPGIEIISEVWTEFYHAIVLWFGHTFFNIEIIIFENGSGDTTYNYLLVLCILILSFTGSLIWSLIDRKKSNYQKLFLWLEIFVRYYLVYFMFVYGFSKIIKTQFPYPFLSRLQQPYGDSSPMGLAWTFMGYSGTYNYFAGFAEVLAGVLLLFKRTTLLGGIITIAVMSNVAAMNFSFDIPVKLFSLHLMMFGFLLIYKDLKSLFDYFIRNENAIAPKSPSVINSVLLKKIIAALKIILIGWLLYTNIYENYTFQITNGDFAPKPPLYGIYNTENFIRNRDTLEPLTTNEIRWKTLTLDEWDRASVRLMNDTIKKFTYAVDTISNSIEFKDRFDSSKSFTLNYQINGNKFFYNGIYYSDTINVSANKKNPEDFLLMSRGFHWINELPFNR